MTEKIPLSPICGAHLGGTDEASSGGERDDGSADAACPWRLLTLPYLHPWLLLPLLPYRIPPPPYVPFSSHQWVAVERDGAEVGGDDGPRRWNATREAVAGKVD